VLKQITEKIRDWKCSKYLKRCAHPEVENYGLNCDTTLWVDFNKECLIRGITMDERIINGVPVPLSEQKPLSVERDYAIRKIEYLQSNGVLDYNYIWRGNVG
jgi:hypothetical protein